MASGKATKTKRNRQLTVSSMDKIFPERYTPTVQTRATVFRNEIFHFQTACYTPLFRSHIAINVSSDIKERISVRVVELIPSRGAILNTCEKDDYFIKAHGNNELYPDLLRPYEYERECLRARSWTGFWFTVSPEGGLPAGIHEIKINIRCNDGAYDETSVFTLEVLNAELPKPDFTYTEWLHCDCICDRHGAKPFSEKFYGILGKYLDSAVSHGMNMLYTPLFTPSLDTDKKLKNYRTTVQLVKVKAGEGGKYSFDFSETEKFMKFAEAHGIKKFELSHLASQHGAEFAANVIADVKGERKRIFGWDALSDSEEYLGFLDAFLPALSAFFESKGYSDKVYYHISDEPKESSVNRFLPIRKLLEKHVKDLKVTDALSHRKFYDDGIINYPAVFLGEYDDFPAKWVYYCGCAQDKYVTNRLFAMPSQRTRIFGFQAYVNGITGFLHWGFNFFDSVGSLRKIDPFLTSDRDYGDSGDAYIVYPDVYGGGVFESLRHEVFADGLNDMRACHLLERFIGREKTVKFLKDQGIGKGFSDYPRDEKTHIEIRERLNDAVKKYISER